MSGDAGERRDVDGYEARKERERSPVPGTVRAHVDPSGEITGNYSGEELAFMRESERSLPERVALLEVKDDHKRDEIAALRIAIGDARLESSATRVKVDQMSDRLNVVQSDIRVVKSELASHQTTNKTMIDAQNLVLADILSNAKRAADRDHLIVTKQVEVDSASALASINVQEASELADVDITKRRELDAIKAKALWRKTVAKAIGVFVGGGLGIWKLYEIIKGWL